MENKYTLIINKYLNLDHFLKKVLFKFKGQKNST